MHEKPTAAHLNIRSRADKPLHILMPDKLMPPSDALRGLEENGPTRRHQIRQIGFLAAANVL